VIPALAHILSTTVLPALCGYKLLAKEGRAYAGTPGVARLFVQLIGECSD
jgi:hypothetical protein